MHKDSVLPPCTLSSDCVANPVMQTVSSLPGGTSAPNTVITEYAMSKYHQQASLNGWLIQAPAPFTATQISAAQHLALAYQVTVETRTDAPSLGEQIHLLSRPLRSRRPGRFSCSIASTPTVFMRPS